MIYPCKNCLVYPTCIEPCDKMIFFLDSLIGSCGNYIPDEWLLTRNKIIRILNCYELYGYYNSKNTRMFCKLIKSFEKLHGVKLWDSHATTV